VWQLSQLKLLAIFNKAIKCSDNVSVSLQINPIVNILLWLDIPERHLLSKAVVIHLKSVVLLDLFHSYHIILQRG